MVAAELGGIYAVACAGAVGFSYCFFRIVVLGITKYSFLESPAMPFTLPVQSALGMLAICLAATGIAFWAVNRPLVYTRTLTGQITAGDTDGVFTRSDKILDSHSFRKSYTGLLIARDRKPFARAGALTCTVVFVCQLISGVMVYYYSQYSPGLPDISVTEDYKGKGVPFQLPADQINRMYAVQDRFDAIRSVQIGFTTDINAFITSTDKPKLARYHRPTMFVDEENADKTKNIYRYVHPEVVDDNTTEMETLNGAVRYGCLLPWEESKRYAIGDKIEVYAKKSLT